MDLGTLAIITLSLLLVLWYGIGHFYNRQHGQRLFRWVEKGLHVLGKELESGWIGSPAAGARINITHALPPFRRLEITLLLENREIPLLWLLDHLREKQDRIIIRATLRSPRRVKINISPDKEKLPQQEAPWKRQEGPHGLVLAYQGNNAQKHLKALKPWLEKYGGQLHRFYWCKHDPHITLQMKITELQDTSAETFFTDLSSALNSTE